MAKIYTGIGSRETPEDILLLMEIAGRVLCDRGWRLRSGGAIGADSAFYAGARMSERFAEVNAEIFLPWNGVEYDRVNHLKHWHDPVNGFFDATLFHTWEDTYQIAADIHGGFEHCGRGAIAMHRRNVYQILGSSLEEPAKFVIFWAKPKGKLGLVSGGTNTAVQLAIKNNIEVINMYTDEGRRRVEDFIAPKAV